MTDYSFWRHRWPRASSIEFNAYAFQGPYDVEPVLKHYKGTFSRNLLDSSIITVSGNIYDIKVGACGRVVVVSHWVALKI